MRHLFLILSLFLSLACIHAKAEVHRVVNVSEAGQLDKTLGVNASEITSITVSGNLNDDDIFKLRYLTYFGELTDIDISQANIVGNRLPDNAFYNQEYYLAKNPYGGYYHYISKLKTISLPENLAQVGKSAFQLAKNLESVVLPDGIDCIPMYCFASCWNLKSFNLPKSLESIDMYAFYCCSSLDGNIIFPEGITEIQDLAFYGNKFTFIVFPSTLKVLGQYSFATGSPKILRGVSCKAMTPPVYNRFSTQPNWMEYEEWPFSEDNPHTAKLYIPRGTFDLYDDRSTMSFFWSYQFRIYINGTSAIPECGIIETDIFPTSAEEMPMSGIENVSVETQVDNAYYNLKGRKVEHPSKGDIYIHNRQKVRY